MKKPVFIFENYRASYRTRKGLKEVAGPVTLSLFEGEALGVIGESGAGKSTLGLEVLGLLGHRGGSCTGGSRQLMLKAREIGFIPQDPSAALDPLFSIGNQLRETGASREEIRSALARVHLPLEKISLKSYPHELSGGMRQRVVIALALLSSPRLLVADEPTSSLDVTLQAEMMKLFKEIHGQGVSFLFITHNLPLAALFCDRLVVMRAGKVVEIGTPEEIMEAPRHDYTKQLVAAIPVLRL